MGFGVTTLFYLAIGAGVAAAVFLSEGDRPPAGRVLRVATATAFWPIYLPILLARPRSDDASPEPAIAAPRDAMAEAIARVEAELDAAFSSLDGWAEDVLAHEVGRLSELRSALNAQADRIRAMDRLLAAEAVEADDPIPIGPDDDRRSRSERARRANVRPARARPSARARRADGHIGLGPRAGLDDPSGEIHRGARLEGRRAGGADRRGRRGGLGGHRGLLPANTRGGPAMRFLRRVGDVIGANLNDLVDRLDDPELMLRQAVREMDDAINVATAAAARAIAGDRRLADERSRHDRQAGLWQTRAERAVADGDDDLARRALARRLEHDSAAEALGEQWTAAREASQSLRRQVETMKARRDEASGRLSILAVRRRAADAFRALRGLEAGPDSPFGARGFARFARLREAVELAEAEARASVELQLGDDRDDLEAALAARDDARRIERELAAIKEAQRRGDDRRAILRGDGLPLLDGRTSTSAQVGPGPSLRSPGGPRWRAG